MDALNKEESGVAVPRPTFRLLYDKKDITREISPMVLDVTYTDAIKNDSDSLDISLENAAGKWLTDWYPTLGATLTLSIGYEGLPLIDCGSFQIDEINIASPPSTVRIRALSASVKTSQRTPKSKAYNDMTLDAIVSDVAKRNKLMLKGDIEPIPIHRATQAHETDLNFIKRVAAGYGYAFNVKGDILICYKLESLKTGKTVSTIDLSEGGNVFRYNFTDKIKDIVKKAKVKHHSRKRRKTIKAESPAEGNHATSGDNAEFVAYAENEQQATAKSKAAVNKQNDEKTTGNLSLAGNPVLRAGLTIELAGIGKVLSGKWMIDTSRHSISRSNGYTTDIDLKKVD